MDLRARLILAASVASMAALAACAPPRPRGVAPLPHAVAVQLRTLDHQDVSLYVAVEPNQRGTLDVRLTEGNVVPSREKVYSIAEDASGWIVTGRKRTERAEFDLPAGAWKLSSVVGLHAYFSTGDEVRRCALATAICEETGEHLPAPKMTHSGPEAGFRLRVDAAGDLRLALPHQEDAEAEVIAEGVGRVVGVRWVSEPLRHRVREYLDRTFRGRAKLTAPETRVVVDGDLSEWTAAPVVVDAPWQADARRGWTGASDASFAVAAASNGDQLCFAGRLRDDVITDRDTLVLHVGPAWRKVSVLDPGSDAVIAPEWFGSHFEVCMRMPVDLATTGRTALAVSYRDADDGQEGEDAGAIAVLSTAPRVGEWAAGSITLERPIPGSARRAAR